MLSNPRDHYLYFLAGCLSEHTNSDVTSVISEKLAGVLDPEYISMRVLARLTEELPEARTKWIYDVYEHERDDLTIHTSAYTQYHDISASLKIGNMCVAYRQLTIREARDFGLIGSSNEARIFHFV